MEHSSPPCSLCLLLSYRGNEGEIQDDVKETGNHYLGFRISRQLLISLGERQDEELSLLWLVCLERNQYLYDQNPTSSKYCHHRDDDNAINVASAPVAASRISAPPGWCINTKTPCHVFLNGFGQLLINNIGVMYIPNIHSQPTAAAAATTSTSTSTSTSTTTTTTTTTPTISSSSTSTSTRTSSSSSSSTQAHPLAPGGFGCFQSPQQPTQPQQSQQHRIFWGGH